MARLTLNVMQLAVDSFYPDGGGEQLDGHTPCSSVSSCDDMCGSAECSTLPAC